MSKWIPRLIGVLVILMLGLFVASTWFRPDVPEVLQRDLDLQVQGQAPGNLRPVPQNELEPLIPDPPPAGNAPTLTLTSLEDIPEEGSAPPVLTNPQPDNPVAEAPVPRPQPQPQPVRQAAQLEERAPAPQAARQTPPQNTAPAAAPTSGGGSWIAAGAFGNPENTERRVAQLRSRGWPVKVEKIQSGGKTLDRVMLGPIPANQVNTYLDELDKMGVQGRQIQ